MEVMGTPVMDVVSPVSGTGDSAEEGIPVSPVDGNLLVVGFLIVLGFSGASGIALAFASIRYTNKNVPPESVQAMIQPILQTTYDGWVRWGVQVRETPDIKDDVGYAIVNAPFEMLVEHMRKMGYTLVKEEPAVGAAGENPFVE